MTDSSLEPWQWDEGTWRPVVEHVRAGRDLTPAQWPNGAKVAVAISFDADHETPALREADTSPGSMASGQYGIRVGVPRVLQILGRHRVPASFFVPAVSALLHPEQIDSYLAGGHEVGVHGWIHERNALLSRADERDLMARSIEVLEKLVGSRPVGLRTPSWDYSTNTLSLIREFGLLYDSSLMAADDPYELVEDGEPTGVVELPVEWIRDDAPYFSMARFASLRPYTPPHEVLRIWWDEFQGALAEGGLFLLTMHPHCSGHRSRAWLIDELLDRIADTKAAWFATHEQVARYVLEATPRSEAKTAAGTRPAGPPR